QFLSEHSPVFDAMFFGDFAEKGKEELEIKDVVYEEFLDLLDLAYLRTMEITDHTVSNILKIADRFQIEGIVKQSEKHLIQSEGFNDVQKLLFADKYRLASLKDHCLMTAEYIARIKTFPEYDSLSDSMKAEISDRLVEISNRRVIFE
ncbi:hypothetical protein PMAYCL1PPCAC_24992, partial [Pristionchus mayeri]